MASDAFLILMTSRTHRVGRRRRPVHRVSRDAFIPNISAMRSASLAVGSATAYRRAVQLWLEFCRHHSSHRHLQCLTSPAGVRHLDQCVCVYLEFVYHHGGGRRRQLGVNTVYGLYYYYPSLRRQLAESEQSLHGWARLRPSVSHPPLTWPLVTLLAVTMAMNGYGEGALATLVAFDGLLRISEMASLRVGDVSPPSDLRQGGTSSSVGRGGTGSVVSGHVLLRLAVTKTGSNQWVELSNSTIENLLLRHVTGRPHSECVFRLELPGHRRNGARAYRHAFRVVCRDLGLECHHYTPHSLRHGGATHALMHLHQSVETVMQRGRWQSVRSCRIYLQAGRARLLQQTIAPAILSLAQTVSGDWYETVRDGLL
jgi:integrase